MPQKILPVLRVLTVLICFFVIAAGNFFLPAPLFGSEGEPAGESEGEKETELTLPENPFTRLTRDEKGQLDSFETSFVTYASADGSRQVTLVAAIHIGEKQYYRELNRRFQDYDTVLFEMVGDGDPRPVSARESGGLIGRIQRLSALLMRLEFQIGSINYHAPNFVHADMTSEEFNAAMRRRRDGLLVWFLRTYGYEMTCRETPNPEAEILFLKLLVSPHKCQILRQLNAPGVADIRSTLIPVEGKHGSSLVADRNAKALQILQSELDSGKKNVAIFYGAAHLPGMAEKLQTDFHLHPKKIEWLQCWKLQ